jgi:hypothetical protein
VGDIYLKRTQLLVAGQTIGRPARESACITIANAITASATSEVEATFSSGRFGNVESHPRLSP